MKAFSYGSLPSIKAIVDAYELLVSQDLADKCYKYQLTILNKEVEEHRARIMKEYETSLEGALMGSVVAKPSFVKREFLQRRFQIVYGLFQRKGLILDQEVFAEL